VELSCIFGAVGSSKAYSELKVMTERKSRLSNISSGFGRFSAED
jgi:hypothetical protein